MLLITIQVSLWRGVLFDRASDKFSANVLQMFVVVVRNRETLPIFGRMGIACNLTEEGSKLLAGDHCDFSNIEWKLHLSSANKNA